MSERLPILHGPNQPSLDCGVCGRLLLLTERPSAGLKLSQQEQCMAAEVSVTRSLLPVPAEGIEVICARGSKGVSPSCPSRDRERGRLGVGIAVGLDFALVLASSFGLDCALYWRRPPY